MSPGGARKLIVLCEGDTEELAVKYFISRQWASDGLQHVALRTVNLAGKLQQAPRKAALYLDDPTVLAVFTLVDLWGMGRVQHAPKDSLETKVNRVAAWFKKDFSHPRAAAFRPHVCVHETEAWFLAEGAALASRLQSAKVKPDTHAEEKNFRKPPKKRVHDLFRQHKARAYGENIDGRPLFSAMQFHPVYESCKFFRAFYDDLRSLA